MFAATCAFGQDSSLSLSWLPDQLMMPAFTANSTAHGVSLTRILKNNQYIGGMGSMVPVVTATIHGHEVQFSFGGTVYTQILRSRNHLEVVNVDFYVDVLADYRLDEERILRFGYGHTSQHFVDDAFEILGYGHSINYVRDYFQSFLLQRKEGLKIISHIVDREIIFSPSFCNGSLPSTDTCMGGFSII